MKKYQDLLNWFDDKKSVLISLSGGVDSALVAYAAFEKIGNNAIALTADYKTLAQEELDSAKKITEEIGIRHMLISYDELQNEDFVRNDNNRCFYCRDELSEKLLATSKQLGIDVIVDGGISRGTHMLKALSLGAKACGGGRLYLYALAAAGQVGVERALNIYKKELERDMKLMGCTKLSDLNRNNLRFRNI